MLIRPGAAGIRNAGDIATLVPDDAIAIKALPNVETALPERSTRITVRYGNLDILCSSTRKVIHPSWPNRWRRHWLAGRRGPAAGHAAKKVVHACP